EQRTITFTIDGREVQAPENAMLVDAAKYGDVEIPVFCYEPKLGNPVGACRMCLVEIEGIGKLQTGCSTPVKDGMVVHTQYERGAQSFVSTFDGHPYVAPFSGNIIELCPVGALTSRSYRFRARPWDIEDSGSVCTLCPAQCNVSFTVRDERVMRVLAREHDQVDDGWLCDKGRFAYQAIHVDERITRPLVRDGGELREVSWERALEAAAAIAKHKGRIGALVGGQASNEEGFLLQRL